MTRLRAFVIHLSASATLMPLFLGIIWFIWYPAPYFVLNGGWTALSILAGVGVALGPILTLIVFRPGKPGLRFDLGVILALQLAALAYGGALLYQQRPAFIVFAVDRFTVIPAAEVDFARLRYPELKRLFGVGPLFAQALPPEDREARTALMFAVALNGAKDLEYRSELYHPYPPDLAALSRRSIDLGRIAAQDAEVRGLLEPFLERRGGQADDYLYFPLRGRHRDVLLVLSRADGQPAGWIGRDPWTLTNGEDREAGPAASGVGQH